MKERSHTHGGVMPKQKYRLSEPEDIDCDDEEEELDALHEHVQRSMNQSGPLEILDGLLIVSNTCEMRALIHANPDMKAWYARLSQLLRLTLANAATEDLAPNYKLEDPALYFEDPKQYH